MGNYSDPVNSIQVAILYLYQYTLFSSTLSPSLLHPLLLYNLPDAALTAEGVSVCVCVCFVRKTDRLRAKAGSREGGYFCRLEFYPFIINMFHQTIFKTEDEQQERVNTDTHTNAHIH